MPGNPQLQTLILLWMFAGSGLFVVRWKFGQGCGLLAAYVLELFALHWLAAAIYLIPGYRYLDPVAVLAGLSVATVGMIGFTVGALAATAWDYYHFGGAGRRDVEHPATADPRLIRIYFAVGVVSYVVLGPTLGGIPTISALIGVGSSFVVVGLALGCWNAAHGSSRTPLVVWMMVVAALPFITIAIQGFMGYGLAAAAVVFAFVASFYRATWRTIIVTAIAAYLGLSLYVTYMRDRSDIREVVWGGSSMATRFDQLEGTFAEFEPFDINNPEHLYRIDMRLNQNFLVGAAVDKLRGSPDLFARGETLTDALLAVVPRVLWPDKPVSGGSGDLVTRFTGIRFAEGTSVGVGQVLELYVNFAETGVFFGFLALGAILALIDRRAAEFRGRGEWSRFACWFVPGIAMLQVGGSLVEVTSATGAAIIVSNLMAMALRPPQRHVRERIEAA